MTGEEFKKHIEHLRFIKANATWLQGVGAHAGKPAGEVVPGDVLVWNGGATSTVLRKLKETAKTITFETQYDTDKTFHTTIKKSRIVAIQGMGVYNVTREECGL